MFFSGTLNYLLKQGYTPTRLADRVAISVGGASMYRNRINTYLKQGKTREEAEKQAMEDWIELTNENQQSSRPDRISYQQASTLGKTILNFANTPIQYNQLMYRSYLNIKDGRGNAQAEVSKILHYGIGQATVFTMLQQAIFALATGDPGEDAELDKIVSVADSMTSTWLRGTGFGGAIAEMNKQVFMQMYRSAQGENFREDMGEAAWKVFSVSPPLSSKVDKFRRAT